MDETVLITGGSGFVGGWTIVELLRRGFQVRATVRGPQKAEAVRRAVGTQVDADNRLSFVEADLNADAGWDVAVAGCKNILHIASPMGGAGPDDDLVETARDGTLRVLRAAVASGVDRVVVTSSTAACTPAKPMERAIDENDWTDPNEKGLSTYRLSKAVAERAAWDFMAHKTTTMTMTTLLPGAIFGPVLTKDHLSSVGIIQRLLAGTPPALPRLGFNITDVRDLADLHIRAMQSPDAAGQRFIALGDALWYGDVAAILKRRLGAAASKVPTASMPDLAFKAAAAVSPQMKGLLPLLGRTQKFSNEKARRILGYAPRAVEDTIADTGASLLV